MALSHRRRGCLAGDQGLGINGVPGRSGGRSHRCRHSLFFGLELCHRVLAGEVIDSFSIKGPSASAGNERSAHAHLPQLRPASELGIPTTRPSVVDVRRHLGHTVLQLRLFRKHTLGPPPQGKRVKPLIPERPRSVDPILFHASSALRPLQPSRGIPASATPHLETPHDTVDRCWRFTNLELRD